MIRMSQDFCYPVIEKQAKKSKRKKTKKNVLFELHQLRTSLGESFFILIYSLMQIEWTFSFVHFNISDNGHLCNPKTNEVDERNIMKPQLVKDLKVKYKVKNSTRF